VSVTGGGPDVFGFSASINCATRGSVEAMLLVGGRCEPLSVSRPWHVLLTQSGH
jgi:hypothetical protein